MADAQYPEYVVTLNGTEYTMRLSDKEAEFYGDRAVKKTTTSTKSASGTTSTKRAPEPKNKSAE